MHTIERKAGAEAGSAFLQPLTLTMMLQSAKGLVFSIVAAVAFLAGGAQANPNDRGQVLKPAKVAGKWRMAWDVRFGTVRGILVLKQSGAGVTGTFLEYGKRYPLSGNIDGHSITFEIPFSGPRPYTIEFKGTIDGAKINGTSFLKGGGGAF